MLHILKICTLFAATETEAKKPAKKRRCILSSVRNVSSKIKFDELNQHPKVMSSECALNIDRLKAGPENIPEVIHKKQNYVDPSFNGFGALYGNHGTTSWATQVKSRINSGWYSWSKWSVILTPSSGYDVVKNGALGKFDAIQGSLGDCYWIAASAAYAQHPNAKETSLITQSFNTAGIYAFTLYIRGIPWVVSVDGDVVQAYGSPVYAEKNYATKAIWNIMGEKALAKLKGSYYSIGEGGFTESGLSLWTGVPIAQYTATNTAAANQIWSAVQVGLAAGYVVTSGSAGGGNDQVQNSCGIAMSHAFSILGAFQITDSGITWNLLLARNPWGQTYYSSDWKNTDSRWTTQNKAQVPFGLGDQVTSRQNGLFVIPIDKLVNNLCFDGIQIAQIMSGYGDNRYDYENYPVMGFEQYLHFDFSVPVIDSSVWISVQSYNMGIMPKSCFTGNSYGTPLVDMEWFKGNQKINYAYYYAGYPKFYEITTSQLSSSPFKNSIYAQIDFQGFAIRDFTVKVYSKHTFDITLRESGQNIKTNYDGTYPSSFTCSNYFGMGNCEWGSNECSSWTKSPYSTKDTSNCIVASSVVTPSTVAPAGYYYNTAGALVPTQSSSDVFDPDTYPVTTIWALMDAGLTFEQFNQVFWPNCWVIFVWFEI